MAFNFLLEENQRYANKLCSDLQRFGQEISIPIHKLLLFTHDILLICIGFFSSIYVYHLAISPLNLQNDLLLFTLPLAVYLFVYAILCKFNKVLTYNVVLNKAKHFSAFFRIFLLGSLLIYLTLYIINPTSIASKLEFVIINLASLLVLFTLSRVLIIPFIFESLIKSRIVNRNLAIVGICASSIKKATYLLNEQGSYFNVIGFISESDDAPEQDTRLPILGDLNDINFVINNHQINDILICSEVESQDRLFEIIQQCKTTGKRVHVLSSLYGILYEKLDIDPIGSLSAFRIYPYSANTLFKVLKRTVDVVLGSLIVLCLLPFLTLIAILIKLDTSGPIFYKPTMIGKDGEPFEMFKFRSMRHNCPKTLHEEKVKNMILTNGDTKKLENDPRITRVGRVLRKLSFDEFPQLINVIKGNMSLVGPRPCLPYEFEVMKKWQKKRTAVKPGMTGLWQIKGRNEVLFNDQILLDLYYIEHQSILLDVEILFETIPVVIFGRGGK